MHCQRANHKRSLHTKYLKKAKNKPMLYMLVLADLKSAHKANIIFGQHAVAHHA